MDETPYYESNQYDVPISILRPSTKSLLATLLNPRKIILTDSGLPRDWHGLAELVGIGGEIIPNLKCGCPTQKILEWWYKKDQELATVKKLLLYLEQLDRFDVIDDVKDLLDGDLKAFEEHGTQMVPISVNLDAEKDVLTRDDLERIEEGLEPQKYDAFVLFADDDADFAVQLIDKLENQYKLKLCVKDRDLVVGVFVHDSVIRLIAERCNRLVVIISTAFLESNSNKFVTSFAQTIGIEQQQRKIIPCTYGPCQIPPHLSCYFILDYRRVMGNFWERLREAIRPVERTPKQQNISRSASQRIPPISENKQTKHLQFEENCLKPKNEVVKFNSMMNLSYSENDNILLEEKLNPTYSATSLSGVTAPHKKNKIKTGWLKKILPHKSNKCTSNIIEEVPVRQKKGFWARHTKRKVAVAN